MESTALSRRKKGHKPLVERELALLDWAARGATLAIDGERQVLVDRGLPGERVIAQVDRRKKPWRGVVQQVLEPSSARVEPSCPYYHQGCGGCQWQHVAYNHQREQKIGLVEQELIRQGLDLHVTGVHSMEEPWRYRHTAAIAIGWEAGFRPRGRRGIVEIHDCPIAHPLIGRLAHSLNELLRSRQVPNYHGKVWLDCTVVGSSKSPSLQVLIQGIEGLTLESHPELPLVAESIAAVHGVATVAYRHRRGEPMALLGPLESCIEVGGRMMWLPAGSFFQTNLALLPDVIDRMEGRIEGRGLRRAADVYGGVGTLGLPLSRHVERMTIIELDPRAIDAARRTAADWGLRNVEFVDRHAERALPDEGRFDLVVVDPPRSGLGEPVIHALQTVRPQLILYLSCSPVSLSRDLSLLCGTGYRVETLDVFDFYPQTYHVETLAVLSV